MFAIGSRYLSFTYPGSEPNGSVLLVQSVESDRLRIAIKHSPSKLTGVVVVKLRAAEFG